MSGNMDTALPMPLPSGTPAFSVDLSALAADPLMQSEARFRALAQATGQIYWICDAQGRLTDTTSWCAFTGQTADEASGDGWAAALHPDDREPTLEDWKAAIADGRPYRHEHRARRADGEYRSMLVQAYPVLDAEGAVQEWVGIDTDITLLGELRADVEASQEEFRATFEQAAVGIAHVRLHDGRILRSNQKFSEILGYAPEEVQRRTFQELTYPPDLDTNLALLEQLLAGEISTYTIEKRYIRQDGSLVWVTLTSSLKRNRSGTPEYGIAVIEDISARKAAEEALRQSEQQFRQLFETMAQGVIYYSASGEILSANPAALRILGLTQEEMLSRTAFDPRGQAIYEDGSPHTTETRSAARALRTGQIISDSLGFFNVKEQAIRWLQVTAIPEYLPGESAPYRVFATFEDITERQRLEVELRARVQELETIFASINEGLVVLGADGQILRTNPAYAALAGWPAGSALYTMTPEERLRALDIRNAQGLSIRLDQFSTSRLLLGERVAEEQIFRRPDGREVYVHLRGAPLTDAAGRVMGAVIVLHDDTERRQLEQQTYAALQALLRMAEVLVQQPLEREEHLSPLMWQHLAELACSLLGCPVATIVTLDSKTLRMQVLATAGYSPAQEEQARSVISSWSHTTMDLALLARLRAGEPLVLEVTEPYQKQPTLFEVSQVIAAPMQLGGQMIGMVVFHPSKLAQTFTDQQIALASATAQLVGLAVERERLLREREEAHASALALAETNRQMDTFLGLASHELRTPLAILKLSLQLLRRGFEQMSGERQAAGDMEGIPTLKPFLETAERQMRRLERLVKDLLSAARAREGTMDLRMEPVDLGILVQEVVEEQRLLTPERSILLDPPADPPLVARADGDHIRQAMMNYLTNALKYSPEPMPVQVGLEQKAGQAHFWVRDEGPGIPLADHEHLWERFHQVPGIREQSRLTGGLGLGLYLTKMLIEQHHGQVGIISLPGQGSTFWFSLPLVQGERAE